MKKNINKYGTRNDDDKGSNKGSNNEDDGNNRDNIIDDKRMQADKLQIGR